MSNCKNTYYLNLLDIQIWESRGKKTIELMDVSSEKPVSELTWQELESQVAQCQRCELYKTRTHAVFGVGNRNTRLMIIGEAPGANEDKQGEPFVGRAGKLLNSMLKAIGFNREEVYIANVVKSRPPSNRDPLPEEVAACIPYLERQIELIKPEMILVVGRIAAQHLLKTNMAMAQMRGKEFFYGNQRIPLLVTYHPAYLLRSPREKRKVWQDLQQVLAKLQN